MNLKRTTEFGNITLVDFEAQLKIFGQNIEFCNIYPDGTCEYHPFINTWMTNKRQRKTMLSSNVPPMTKTALLGSKIPSLRPTSPSFKSRNKMTIKKEELAELY
jgi:hypothetical protein